MKGHMTLQEVINWIDNHSNEWIGQEHPTLKGKPIKKLMPAPVDTLALEQFVMEVQQSFPNCEIEDIDTVAMCEEMGDMDFGVYGVGWGIGPQLLFHRIISLKN